jgi:thioredoxin-related protein
MNINKIKLLILLLSILLITCCFNNTDTTHLKIGNQQILLLGFSNSGNIYVIKFKEIKNRTILNNLLKKYEMFKPRFLKHINSISINVVNNDLKSIITDFLQVGEIEYVERTAAKTLYN